VLWERSHYDYAPSIVIASDRRERGDLLSLIKYFVVY